MKKVTNTPENPNFEWLCGGNPNAIEAQEKRGQDELAKSCQLPAKINSGGSETKSEYEKLGIKVIGVSKGDNLFLDVELPEGWKVQPTTHSMWSNLLDDKGNEIASIFYKAAFYDMAAFINIKQQ